MPTAEQTNELQEILNILDPDIGHFPDKLAKWMFKIPEFLHGLVFMLKDDIVRCRRDKNEQPQLLRMINTHTENEEVERIIMTGIEALIQEGLEQGKVEIHEQGKAEGLEQGKAEGLEQGKAEGLEQGRIYEKRTDVLKLVRYKFADISDTILNEINGIDDLVCLDDLFDQVLTAESFEDIDFSNNGK